MESSTLQCPQPILEALQTCTACFAVATHPLVLACSILRGIAISRHSLQYTTNLRSSLSPCSYQTLECTGVHCKRKRKLSEICQDATSRIVSIACPSQVFSAKPPFVDALAEQHSEPSRSPLGGLHTPNRSTKVFV